MHGALGQPGGLCSGMAELDFDDHADESRIYSTWERAPAFLELLKKVVESDLCSDVPISSEEREAHRLLTIYVGQLPTWHSIYPTKMSL